jgi:FKBP-type peptidyl-prolyl cis-trans isomerase 2
MLPCYNCPVAGQNLVYNYSDVTLSYNCTVAGQNLVYNYNI